MTELTSAGRAGGPLLSQAVITDGNWHRIGLVWDGSHRTLYVDSVVVAEDTQDDLESPGSSLYIGCGDPIQPSTFWSGLIDDIRIYNRAVKP
ncbi:MAG: LamG domain-containing protein [Phycisphaerales bacterium]|nr:MAG: LamG domain-containing protein [Phycisphaerales bacterium]